MSHCRTPVSFKVSEHQNSMILLDPCRTSTSLSAWKKAPTYPREFKHHEQEALNKSSGVVERKEQKLGKEEPPRRAQGSSVLIHDGAVEHRASPIQQKSGEVKICFKLSMKTPWEELEPCLPAARTHKCFPELEFEKIIAIKIRRANRRLYHQVAKCLSKCVNTVIAALLKGK